MAKESLINKIYKRALHVLRNSAKPEGFVASSAFEHYDSIWIRDACLSLPGALASGNRFLINTSKRTLQTTADTISERGKVVNSYNPKNQSREWGELGCADTNPLFIFAAGEYLKHTGDVRFVKKIYPALEKAYQWITYQDPANYGLFSAIPANTWQDSTLAQEGYVFNLNVFYYMASVAMIILGDSIGNKLDIDSEQLRRKINFYFWPERRENLSKEYPTIMYSHLQLRKGEKLVFPHTASLKDYDHASYERNHYASHIKFAHHIDKCDVLSDLLAIIYNIADYEKANRIIDYLQAQKAADPYPAKSWVEPETSESKLSMWDKEVENLGFQETQWTNKPKTYHNGGIWPFIGGVYVTALCKIGKIHQAESELEALAQANNLGIGFHEWINPRTKKPGNRAPANQTWNAAWYVMAYLALRIVKMEN